MNPNDDNSNNEIREHIDLIDHPKKARMIEELIRHRGIVSIACRNADVKARNTHYRWLAEDPVYREAVELAKEAAIDHVESKLFELVDGVTTSGGLDDEGNEIIYKQPPNVAAVLFYLKTIGQKRGYIEKKQIDVDVNQKTTPFQSLDIGVVDIDAEIIDD